MKKLLIYYNSMSNAGGVERVIANLANQWNKKYQIHVLVKDSGEFFYPLEANIAIDSLNIPLHLNMNNRIQRITSVTKNCIKSLPRLKKYIREIKPDYIYVATPMTALEIFLLGKKYCGKLVISEHSSNYAYNHIYQIVRAIVYPKAYKISVPNKSDTQLYIKRGYNAIYIPHLTSFASYKQINNKSHTMINVGRLTSDKQQLLLLQIWKKYILKNPGTKWNLKIIGSGEKNEELNRYIKENNLFKVEILPATPNIVDYYKDASLFLLTSKMEGFGMVLLEAMSYGVPCISFDCPSGPRDIIKNQYNGFLIPCYDEDNFCQKMELLSKSEELRIQFSKNAQETIDTWNNVTILKKWDAIFK